MLVSGSSRTRSDRKAPGREAATSRVYVMKDARSRLPRTVARLRHQMSLSSWLPSPSGPSGPSRLVRFAALLALACVPLACDSRRKVVVYTSLDEVFSAPVLEEFEATTGVQVDEVFDVEANKTTGLYHRLLREHESGRRRADVFWNSEVARTIQLARRGVLAPYESPSASDIPGAFRGAVWTGFAARARIIIYNKERVAESELPRSIWDLTRESFRGEAGIAMPLAGTTATHAGALFSVLGRGAAEKYFQRLVDNGVKVLAGNSIVRDRVATGELKLGLTDTDDAYVAIEKGLPVGIVFPDQSSGFPGFDRPLGTFLIPNTVALVAEGPNSAEGRRFIDFLLSRQTEATLAKAESVQIPLRAGIEGPAIPGMPEKPVWTDVSYEDVASGVEEAREFLQRLFVR